MKKFKGWIIKKITELLKPHIEKTIKDIISQEISIENNSDDDLRFKNEVKFSDLVGHKVELRHFTQEESIFVNVEAVLESSTYIKSKETKEVICKSKGLILVDTDNSVHTLSNIYEYEIRKREVLNQ